MIQFLQAIGKIVFVVVGLEIRERPLKLTLPILQFTKHRLDDPAFFRYDADQLSKCLLRRRISSSRSRISTDSVRLCCTAALCSVSVSVL